MSTPFFDIFAPKGTDTTTPSNIKSMTDVWGLIAAAVGGGTAGINTADVEAALRVANQAAVPATTRTKRLVFSALVEHIQTSHVVPRGEQWY